MINNKNIHFNISHSGFMTVCAVSESPIGIDIEKIRPFNISVSKKVFGNDITKQLLNSYDTDKLFTKKWTEKEAVLKLTGEGLSGIRSNLNSDIYNLYTTFHKDYCITVATNK